MIHPNSEEVPLNSLPIALIGYRSSFAQRNCMNQRTEMSMAGNSGSQLCPDSAFQTGPYKAM